MNRLLLFAGCAALAALAMSCGDDEDAIEIGALLPLTGALASYGEASEAALNEAVDAINEGDGPQVELVVEDTTSVPDVALEKLEEMVDKLLVR